MGRTTRRIAVIGSPGAGKSTLARELGAALGLPVYHLDRLMWGPHWTMRPKEEQIALQQELISRETWIIDGNWRSTMEIRLAAADAVVFLDLPRWVCLWGAIRRRIQYAGRERPDMAPDCPEMLDWEFLTFIWTFPERVRPGIRERLSRLAPATTVVTLRSRSAMRSFLDRVQATQKLAENDWIRPTSPNADT